MLFPEFEFEECVETLLNAMRIACPMSYRYHCLLLYIMLIAAVRPVHSQASAGNSYQRYEGTIAHQPVVIHLSPNGDTKHGYYYYKKVGIPIPLRNPYSGDQESRSDSLILVESPYGDTATEQSELRLHYTQSNGLSGVWISPDGSKSEPVDLELSYPDGAAQFTGFTYVDSLSKNVDHGGRISATTSYNLVLPEGNKPEVEQYLFARIAGLVDCKGHQKDIPSCVRKQSATYLGQTLGEIDTEIMDIPDSLKTEDWTYRFQYFSDQSISVLSNGNDILTLIDEGSDFSGGAHEMYGIQLHTYDLENKRELKLKDVTTADSITLGRLLEKYFRAQYHLTKAQPLSDVLFEDYLAAGDNFYLTERGIGFAYSPYEVASWAQGVVEVFVPFHELKGKLAPWLVKRLNL